MIWCLQGSSTLKHFLLSIFNTVLPALLKRSSFREKFPIQMQRTDVHACCTCHCRFENSYWWITPCFIFIGCQHLPKNNWKTHKCYFQGNYFKKIIMHVAFPLKWILTARLFLYSCYNIINVNTVHLCTVYWKQNSTCMWCFLYISVMNNWA